MQPRRAIGMPAFIIFSLLLSCAEIAPPPGGEEDRSGPYVVVSEPAAGTVNVVSTGLITIRFSERITPGAQTRVHISPRPKTPPELKWRSDRLEIRLRDSLIPNQTYVVSVTGTISDLRRNPADSALVLAFSTGPVVDSGRSTGIVFRDNKPMGGATVLLLPADSSGSVPTDSLQADYVTSTGKDGRYAFRYLPQRTFAMLAFEDTDRDGRLAFGREWGGVGDRLVGPGMPDSLEIVLVPQDTVALGLMSATVTPDRLLRLRMTRAVDLAAIDAANMRVAVASRENSLPLLMPTIPMEARESATDLLHFVLDTIPSGTVRIELVIDTLSDTLRLDSVQLPSFREDATPPVVHSFWPDDRRTRLGVPEIGLTFSEPLNRGLFTDTTFLLRRAMDTSVSLRQDWVSEFHLRLGPSRQLEPGAYELAVRLDEIMDRSGNRSPDTLRVFTLSVLSEDSLGSLSGSLELQGDSAAHPVLLTASDITGKTEYTTEVIGNDYRMELPAGKYRLSVWHDRDRDGGRDDGRFVPFELAEPRTMAPDTITVRARFETAGSRLTLFVPTK